MLLVPSTRLSLPQISKSKVSPSSCLLFGPSPNLIHLWVFYLKLLSLSSLTFGWSQWIIVLIRRERIPQLEVLFFLLFCHIRGVPELHQNPPQQLYSVRIRITAKCG